MIIVAGVGPGNPKYLTIDVYEKIKDMKIVLAFGRISETLNSIRKDIFKVDRIIDIIEIIEKNKDKDILILSSGDPNFYGVVNYLKINGVVIDKVLPGISSFQYMMSKLQLTWQHAKLISLHGREDDIEIVKDSVISVILTDDKNTPSFISEKLSNIGVKGKLFIGYNLSYENELIKESRIGENIEDISSLAVVVIINEMD